MPRRRRMEARFQLITMPGSEAAIEQAKAALGVQAVRKVETKWVSLNAAGIRVDGQLPADLFDDAQAEMQAHSRLTKHKRYRVIECENEKDADDDEECRTGAGLLACHKPGERGTVLVLHCVQCGLHRNSK